MSLIIQVEFSEGEVSILPSTPMNAVTLVGLLETAKLSILQVPEQRPQIVIPRIVPD